MLTTNQLILVVQMKDTELIMVGVGGGESIGYYIKY
jgi:hypothetical protein